MFYHENPKNRKTAKIEKPKYGWVEKSQVLRSKVAKTLLRSKFPKLLRIARVTQAL